MPSDSLLPLLDALLRLRRLEPGELELLLRQLPAGSTDPQAAAQELLHRGWITAEQYASLVPASPPSEEEPPAPEKRPPISEPPPPRETILVGFGDDDAPLDPESADGDRWSLPTEEESAPPPSQPAADSSIFSLETTTPPAPAPREPQAPAEPPAPAEVDPTSGSVPEIIAWDSLAASAPEQKPAKREDETDRRMRQVMAWSGKGLVVWGLFLGSFFLGAWFLRPAFQPRSEAKPATRSAKSAPAAGERRWEDQPIDVDAVIAAQQAKNKATSGKQPPATGVSAPASQPKDKTPPNLDKPPPLPPLRLPAGSILLGREDQPKATAIAFRDNHIVATGDEEGRLTFWDAEKGTKQHSWRGHQDRVNRIVFSTEGRCIASTGNDRTIRVWDGKAGTEVRSWPCDALSLAISPDGRYVAAGCVDGLLRLTDLSGGENWSFPKEPTSGKGNAAPPSPISLAFSPDSATLAVGYGVGYTLLFDLPKRKPTQQFRGNGMVNAVAFSPDGRVLVTAGKDGKIKLWDISTGKEVRTLPSPNNQSVGAMAYSSRSQILASGNWDGAVYVWNLGLVNDVRRSQAIKLPPAGFGQQLDLSPDGRLLACVHGGNPPCVIPIAP